jgi:hypothetical protein
MELRCDCTDQGKKAADPDCEECSGTGTVTITYNPQETFDWYEPGGRWDGKICDDVTVRRQWSDLMPDDIRRNMVLVWEIPIGFIPWAILTPDGEWHGGGGDSVKDMDAWTAEHASILRNYADHLAISVDFHY